MKKNQYLVGVGIVLVSIVSFYFGNVSTAQQTQVSTNEYQVGGILYMQKAAEYRALCYQAFNMAKMSLDMDEKNKKKLPKAERKKPRAVMVDVDETMLDNSPAQVYGVRNNSTFNLPDWYKWGEMRKAKAIPGAVDFAKYALQKGVKIFFVTNRDEVQRQATLDNLKAVGFPDVTNENLMLRQKESSKQARRDAIEKNYRIVFTVGDNLNDHSSVFEKKSVDERFAETDKAKDLFGTKYIVLPNAMYGEWENAIYEYNFKLTDAQKAAKRYEAMQAP